MAKPMDEGATARWREPFNLFSERCSNMKWPQQARMNGHSAMLCTLIKPALTAPLDRVHLAGYHAGALDGVPAEWRALSEHTLNEGQEQTLELVARGGNVLSRQPTGSGKSYCYLLPALAKWAAVARARSACADESTRTKLPLPPLVMVVAPFRELGKDAERQATFLLERLYTDGLLPTVDVLGQPARKKAGRGRGRHVCRVTVCALKDQYHVS